MRFLPFLFDRHFTSIRQHLPNNVWLRENHKLKDLYVLYEIIDRNTDVFPALEDLKFSYGIRLPFKRKDLLKWLPKDLGKCEADGSQRVFFYISDMAKRRREEERKRLKSNH